VKRASFALLAVLSYLALPGEVIVDFTKPNEWRVWRGRNPDPAAGELQTRQRPEGTVFHIDAAKAKEPLFASVGAGYAHGGEIAGTGRVVRLVTRQGRPSPVRQNPGPGLLLTDRSGEHYQYAPIEVQRAGDTVSFVYRLTETGFMDRPWAGDGNGRWDPPMRVTDFFLGYEGAQAEGDITFVRLETSDNGDPVASRETLLGCEPGKDEYRYQGGWVRYVSFPGPRPFRGPAEVYVRTEPSFAGRVRLKVRNMVSKEERVFETDWRGESVFETALPSSEVYEFVDFVFMAPGLRTGSFALKSVEGRFLQSEAEACRLDVETGSPLHILPTSSRDVPVVTLRNPSERALKWKGELVFSDVLGHSFRQPFDLSVEAGRTGRLPVKAKLPAKGHWSVYADITAGDGSKAYPSTRFAVLDPHVVTPHLADGKFRMGINYHYGRFSPKDRLLTLDAMVAAGAKLARIDFGTRAKVEAAGPGQRDWSYSDEGVERFWKRGIAMDSICWAQPQWAATPENRANKVWQNWSLRMPEDRGLAAAYYTEMAARYGRKIAYYEIGNEWELTFPGPVEEAIEIQKLCYAALKKGDPSVTVIPNGWACWDSSSNHVKPEKKDFPERMMVEAKGFYDAHPVHYHGTFRDYRRKLTDRFFARRREMGLDSVPWYSNESALSSVHGNEIPVAEHVWMKIPFAWAHGSRDYIWYNLKATGWDPKDPEQGYGLLTADYYPRPGYAAFAALTTLLSGFDFQEILKSERTREVYRFAGTRGGRAEVVVLGWDAALSSPGSIAFETDAKSACLVDIMGNERPLPLKDGRCAWPIGSRPTAVRFVGAKRVVPDRAALDSIPEREIRPIVVGKGAAQGRPPDLTVDTAAFVHCFYDANPATVHRTWKGPGDNSFKVWVGRSQGRLAFRVDVRDDVHRQTADETRKMSEGDCLRIDLDVAGRPGPFQLGFRLTDDGRSEPWVWSGPRGAAGDIRFTALRQGDVTVYKIALPLEPFGITEQALSSGGVKATFKTDDDDGEGRDLWMGLEDPASLVF